ncbi:RloB family protein [Leptospira kmetyi]|uniref:RloB domain-containing protein n=1 Tax=Leptospira kmetyi TaxID=408139 RepID=A0ABX4N554_9LEPT|nr:RloB family protein [Leptospira kmetyi]PJZ28315.1 hypothetical protein CH378_18505 [Leptospira kmetyi]
MPQKRKPANSRSVEERLFILCEGANGKSEHAYFSQLIKGKIEAKNRASVIVVDSKKNTGKELVKEAKKVRQFKVDKVWIVYDKDGYTMHAQTFNEAEASGVNIAFSSISFEIWILLHFKYTARSFEKSEDVISYLKHECNFNYEKNNSGIYDLIKDKIVIAIKNAQRLRRSVIKGCNPGDKIFNLNPYTDIDCLIAEIDEIVKKLTKKVV